MHVRALDRRYPGQHAAIIDPDTWAAVQEQLARNTSQRQRYTNLQSSSLLTGLVFDERGDRLCPTHTSKKGQRYRYYISQRIMHDAHRHHDGWRLPAPVLENVVRTCLKQFLEDRQRLIDALELINQQPTELVRLIQNAKTLADQLNGDNAARLRGVIERLVQRIELDATTIIVRLEPPGLATALGMDPVRIETEEITIQTPVRLRRRGVEARLIIDQDAPVHPVLDRRLCRDVANAYRWFLQLKAGERPSIRAIAKAEGLHECDVSRTLRLAFLAPDIVETILDGRQPVNLTAEKLRRLPRIPADWADQRRQLGFTVR